MVVTCASEWVAILPIEPRKQVSPKPSPTSASHMHAGTDAAAGSPAPRTKPHPTPAPRMHARTQAPMQQQVHRHWVPSRVRTAPASVTPACPATATSACRSSLWMHTRTPMRVQGTSSCLARCVCVCPCTLRYSNQHASLARHASVVLLQAQHFFGKVCVSVGLLQAGKDLLQGRASRQVCNMSWTHVAHVCTRRAFHALVC